MLFVLLLSDCLFLGTAGFARALKSGAPHCTHGCADSCWEFLENEPLPGPPSFVANTTREIEAIGDDQITYRYGVDTPMSPDDSDDSMPGMFLFSFVFFVFSFRFLFVCNLSTFLLL